MAELALAALLPACGSGEMVSRVRDWDELRVSEVDPFKVSTMPLTTPSRTSMLDLGRIFYFQKDWLTIEGSADDDNFDSSNFQYTRLEYPHEWAARVLRQGKVKLRVGKTCNCVLDSVAAYTKSDETAWLRLQFQRCRHCESTATRAAVVVPVAQAEGDVGPHASNLYAWMCAVSDHAACHKPPPTETSTTTATLAPTTTTTLPAPKCKFEGRLSVQTLVKDYGPGRCLTDGAAGPTKTHQAPSLRGCQISCDLSYTMQAANFGDLGDIKRHVFQINHEPSSCKGYSYNEATKSCAIYYGANSSFDYADGDADWVCYGDVHVDRDSFKYETSFDSECTTPAPTTTSTTVTVTTSTTTSTSTHEVALLSLKDLFAVQPEEGTVFNGQETRFPRRGLEATLLSLQSDCYWAIDYYLLGSPLPVSKETWPKLIHLMAQFGEAAAWPAAQYECPASVTVDRIPVDADVTGHGDSEDMGDFNRTMLRFLLPLLLGIFAAAMALWFKYRLYPQGLEQHNEMGHAELAGVVIAACFASLLTVFLVFWLGQFVAWFFGRIAVKKFALGFASDVFSAAPVLSAVCLPTAITAASVTLVTWLWPKDESPQQVMHMQKELQISYDTMTGEMTHFIS